MGPPRTWVLWDAVTGTTWTRFACLIYACLLSICERLFWTFS